MTYYAIIVAGGSGSRMKSNVPKQFLLLNGKPVIMHTVEAFYHSAYRPKIILVLNPETLKQWNELCKQYHFDIPVIKVAGGANRFDSVKNGLEYVTEESIVAVHDAVRPVISEDLICRSFAEAEKNRNAIPAIKSKDSVRKGAEDSSVAVNRDEIFLVQTPQTFNSIILKRAYEQP
ncbi:MAG TPA: 2-C-methyl-D-erythritol 4-phosphate cytidylyltransferase, partial [Sphingobacteriaceae bacterium]